MQRWELSSIFQTRAQMEKMSVSTAAGPSPSPPLPFTTNPEERALTNPLILNTIFKFILNEKEKLSYRLVSKAWNEEILLGLRTVRTQEWSPINRKACNPSNIKEFLTLLRHSEIPEILVEKIKMEEGTQSSFDYRMPGNHNYFEGTFMFLRREESFQKYKLDVRSLGIIMKSEELMHNLHGFLNELNELWPNVASLEIEFEYPLIYCGGFQKFNSLRLLPLSQLKRLVVLYPECRHWETTYYATRLIAIVCAKIMKAATSLEYLGVSPGILCSLLHFFTSSSGNTPSKKAFVKLHTLHLHLDCGFNDSEWEVLQQMWTIVAHSVKHLQLTFTDIYNLEFLGHFAQRVSLQNLKSLHIDINCVMPPSGQFNATWLNDLNQALREFRIFLVAAPPEFKRFEVKTTPALPADLVQNFSSEFPHIKMEFVNA